MAAVPTTPIRRPGKRPGQELTTVERMSLCAEWSMTTVRGSKQAVWEAWGVSKALAYSLYGLHTKQLALGNGVNLSRGKRSGRPAVMTAEKWDGAKAALAPTERYNWRVWSSASNIPLTSLFRTAKSKGTKAHSRVIKPTLTDKHKADRLAFVLSQIKDTAARHPVYGDHYDVVHSDKKWFYLMEDHQHILLAPGETAPAPPTVKHKSHIPKVMWIATASRPQPERNFNGLTGIYACTEDVQAQRRSKNHEVGDWKEVDVPVTADYYRRRMEDDIVPGIIKHMPWAGLDGRTLVIQHDGALPHTGKGNTDHWPEYFKSKYPRRSIVVVTQPAQSPDLNVLDLGFFRSLQSRVCSASSTSLSDMKDNIERMYWEYDAQTMERVWQSLFSVYNSILQQKGGNQYKLAHTNKAKAQREGTLGRYVEVDRAALGALSNKRRRSAPSKS